MSSKSRRSTRQHQQGTLEVFALNLKAGTIRVKQDPSSGDLGTSVWDSCIILSTYLENNEKHYGRRKVEGKRVLELGAGCGGIAGTYFALQGADVTLTDLEAIVPSMTENVRANVRGLSNGVAADVRCLPYAWGDPIASLSPPYDIIVACDCVYVEHLVEPLVWSLEQLSGPRSTIIIASERRDLVAYELFTTRLEKSFSVRKVPQKDLDPEFADEGVFEVLIGKKRSVQRGSAKAHKITNDLESLNISDVGDT